MDSWMSAVKPAWDQSRLYEWGWQLCDLICLGESVSGTSTHTGYKNWLFGILSLWWDILLYLNAERRGDWSGLKLVYLSLVPLQGIPYSLWWFYGGGMGGKWRGKRRGKRRRLAWYVKWKKNYLNKWN